MIKVENTLWRENPGKTYMVICRDAKEAACLFERMWVYLEDKGIKARGLKNIFTIDMIFSHDKIVFRTINQTMDGYHYDEMVSGNIVDKFLDEHERSREAARITEAMNDIL